MLVALMIVLLPPAIGEAGSVPTSWYDEWPETDFERHTVPLSDITSGGPPKDGIPAIDRPKFEPVQSVRTLGPDEPVIALEIDGDARAYPLSILMWHEIANDTVGGVPVTVTYCPLCNSSIVFERTVKGRVLDFGTTGKLRNSDLVMYDRQTETWWQQFTGDAIVGAQIGTSLVMVPSRLESFSRFLVAYPNGKVLVPSRPLMRRYGQNPYERYDSRSAPYPLFQGPLPDDVDPMMRVVVVDGMAWSLPLLRKQGQITHDGLTLSWTPGQNSALDSQAIKEGRDVGNVRAKRDGIDVVHHITFAFVFNVFHPTGSLNN